MTSLTHQFSTLTNRLPQQSLNHRTPLIVSTILCGLSLLGVTWLVRDYNAWTSFGTGGTPSNLSGYWTITKLRFHRLFNRRDLRDASYLEKKDAPSYLGEIPRRKGGRAVIQPRPLPHRQQPEPIDPEVEKRLLDLTTNLAATHPTLLRAAPSGTEGGSTAGLYVQSSLPTRHTLISEHPRLRGEIAHAHPQDRSLHLALSPKDAAEVVRKEWGELFPLDGVPDGFIMVYAPRNKEELEVVERIVNAAVQWVTGVQV